MHSDIETQSLPNISGAWKKQKYFPALNDFDIPRDMRIFGYLSNLIHLPPLTHGICCLTLKVQLDFVTEAMFCKIFR